MDVAARVLTTDPELNIRLALAGIGMTIVFDRAVREQVTRSG